MNKRAEPERMEVLPALLDHDPEASRQSDIWVTVRGTPADACLIESATADEWRLADAIRGDSMTIADAEAIATLLRLADRWQRGDALRRELREHSLTASPRARRRLRCSTGTWV